MATLVGDPSHDGSESKKGAKNGVYVDRGSRQQGDAVLSATSDLRIEAGTGNPEEDAGVGAPHVHPALGAPEERCMSRLQIADAERASEIISSPARDHGHRRANLGRGGANAVRDRVDDPVSAHGTDSVPPLLDGHPGFFGSMLERKSLDDPRFCSRFFQESFCPAVLPGKPGDEPARDLR
jgi:hypothetical protein